jgi:hypothetical protein
MKNKTIYKLSVADIQHVASEVYGKKLSDDEIEKVIEPIGDNIPWYDIIENVIARFLVFKKSTQILNKK